jgi:N-methylhydantoinase B/oxoprolinase/acetone carboxylase alpha subunit
MSTSNTAPLIDELGDLRARIAALERREAELRKQVADLGTGEHRGNRWVAQVKKRRHSRVDLRALRARHPEIVKTCTVTKTGPYVTLRPEIIDDEAA